jgi:hypothetical protein
MSLPQMNPLAAKLMGGVDYRKQLQQQILDAAQRTDDPAYRERLLEVADGRRPLRTLLNDPAFMADRMGTADPETKLDSALAGMELPDGTPQELQERAKAQLEAMGVQIPSVEELRTIFDEARALQEQADSIVAAERLTGWGGSTERLAEEREREQGQQ